MKSILTAASLLVWSILFGCGGGSGGQAGGGPVTPEYTFVDLGTLGGTGSTAAAINNNNQIVGTAGTNAVPFPGEGPVSHAFLYTHGAGMTDLGSIGGPRRPSTGTALTDSAQVAGSAWNGTDWLGFFTDAGGTNMQSLHPVAGLQTDVTGINPSGQVIGYAYGPPNRSFLYIPGAGFQFLDSISGFTEILAKGINGSGQMAGRGMDPLGHHQAVRIAPNGATAIALGSFGGSGSIATAINDSGQVAGWSSTTNDVTQHAFRYTDGIGLVDLDSLSGGASNAFAINSRGDVVGQANPPRSDTRAFIYTDQKGMRILDRLAQVPAGWTLTSASGINDAGWIVGTATVNSQSRAFLLVPK